MAQGWTCKREIILRQRGTTMAHEKISWWIEVSVTESITQGTVIARFAGGGGRSVHARRCQADVEKARGHFTQDT